jgi:aspartokinase
VFGRSIPNGRLGAAGFTDELEWLARGITGYPNPRTLDLLWSTGELRSVGLLTLHLEELGVGAVGLNVRETGLRVNGAGGGGAQIESLLGEIQRVALEAARESFLELVVRGLADTARCTVVSTQTTPEGTCVTET